MIKLNSAELLFDKQKLYAQTAGVNKSELSADNKVDMKAILLFNSAESSLPAAQQEMLDKMMTACKFEPNQVKFINLAHTSLSLGDILSVEGLKLVLIFGKYDASRNMIALKYNLPIPISGVEVLLTDSLDKLMAEPKLKGTLWNALKVALGL
jgi:hypothetical protein